MRRNLCNILGILHEFGINLIKKNEKYGAAVCAII